MLTNSATTLDGLDRAQSRGEEIANSVSHGVGVLAAMAAYPVLAIVAYDRGGIAEVLAVSTFAVTLMLLYLSSTLFHAMPEGAPKTVLRKLDHAAIYLLIAGTYTPFMLGVLRGNVGWTLLIAVWSCAVVGCIVKLRHGPGTTGLSTALYFAMGWMALFAFDTIWRMMSGWGIFWLLAGGGAYSIGAAFFLLSERVRYFHFVWHLFVLTGSTCHFIAVLFYSSAL